MRRFAFRWRFWVAGLLAGIALLCVPAVAAETASATGETVTTELQPGWNLAGWTGGGGAPVSAIFETIPQLEAAYSWDADAQSFSGAVRLTPGVRGSLEALTPGMGLWLYLGGDEPFTWTRSLAFEAGLADLQPGWNLVTWAGENSIAANALSELRSRGILRQTAGADGRAPATLATGEAFWLRVTSAKQWWQLTPPPRIVFDGRFTAERKREIRAYVDDVIAFFVRRHGVAVPDLTFRFGDAAADMVCGGYAAQTLYIQEACITAVPHEYSHAVQEYLAVRDAEGYWGVVIGQIGPAWLSEGVANHAAAVYEDLTGFRPIEQWTTASIEVGLANDNRLEAIEFDMGVGGDTGANYHLASFAIEWAIEQYGEAALYDFYRNRNGIFSWQIAFADTFGTSVDQFYRRFEAYRASLAAQIPHIEGVVLGSDGKPLPNIRVEAWPMEDGLFWRTITDANGAFSNPTREGVYRLSLFPGETPCHIGWYSSRRGFTTTRSALTKLTVPGATTGITIRLPSPLTELCGKIQGALVNADGSPYTEPPWVTAWPVHDQDGYTGKDSDDSGRFDLDVRLNGVFALSLHSHYVRECAVSPHPDLRQQDRGPKAWIIVGEEDVTGIVITVETGPRRDKQFVDCTVAR